MIHKLRRKFILIASCAILLILSIVLISINSVNSYSNYAESIAILTFIADNNGRMPVDARHRESAEFHMTEELPYEIRYFTMLLDSDGQMLLTDYEHIASVDEDDASHFWENITQNRKNQGYIRIDDSLYMYLTKEITGEALQETTSEKNDYHIDIDSEAIYSLAVFMDCTHRIYRLQRLRVFSVLIGIACFVIFFVVVSFFSKIAVRPVMENYEKQKQFITNAGHELKTPLAIISANAEVIEAMDGESEWTQSILNQVNRLTGLVNDLITLARLEEGSGEENQNFETIDFSSKIREVAEAFRPVIEQQGKQFEITVADNISISGNEKSIHELISILIDNAVKYCDDDGIVRVGLKQMKKQALFWVENSYQDGENVDYSKFFDRFYREDKSHNQEKPGYGIGLSVAEGIVNIHKGKISASYHNGIITFQVLL